MAGFDTFSQEAVTFLQTLQANNSREWFADHKPIYEQHLKEPTKLFAADMCAALEQVTGIVHQAKIYRMHRDLRFSKDKTPYNAHLHISFASGDENGMWFFGLDPSSVALGFGVFEFPKPKLDTFRTKMAGPLGADLMQITNEFHANGFRVSEPALKRVPTGYDVNHAHAEVLRRKGISIWRDIGDTDFATQPYLVRRSIEEMQAFTPLRDFLVRLDNS
ncbi:MAG: DUF2461 domain-containing protein [Paracoccaceae bacterium]